MHGGSNGPIINSRHHGNLPKGNPAVKFAVILGGSILAIGVVVLYFFGEEQKKIALAEEAYLDEYADELAYTENPPSIIDTLENNSTNDELKTADYYYQSALTKEEQKDYQGAIEDYTQTIELAKKYSSEMWNSLNNRGIIYAEQFKDYKQAMADFDRIIKIETNRSNGKINATRLEAGYTNRAYVKKMQGNKQGACDDLYEALYLGVESSAEFIEKQISKNCY